MVDLSIILITYNSGVFNLLRMVKCLKHQGISLATWGDKLSGELIIVNDGSTDGSIDALIKSHIIDGYDRISVVTKENGGVASARNKGMDIANGKYIYFVDVDDIILPNSLGLVLTEAISRDADIANFPFKIVQENSEEDIRDFDLIPCLTEITSAEDFTLEQYMNKYVAMGGSAMWHLLFKQTMIKDMRFDSNLVDEEDYVFDFYAFNRAKKIINITAELPMYYWIKNKNSASYSLSLEKVLKANRIVVAYDKLLHEMGFMPKYFIDGIKFRKAYAAGQFLYGQIRYGCDRSTIWTNYQSLRNEGVFPLIKVHQIPKKFRSLSFVVRILILQNRYLFKSLLIFSKFLKL